MNLSKLSKILVGDTELTRDKQRLLSLALLVAAIAFAWVPHERSITLLGIWRHSFTAEGFLPDFISAAIGVLIVLPLYVRNILKWQATSVYSLLSAAINITLIATLCKIILGDSFSMGLLSYGLISAVTLTWLGMRAVAGLAWIAVFALGISGLLIRNYTMGFFGYLFILCGFLGLLLHAELSPGDMLKEITRDFSGAKPVKQEL